MAKCRRDPPFHQDSSSLVLFTAGQLSFVSAACEWLVIFDGKLQLKGRGTINGKGGYTFLLNAIDNRSAGCENSFRIKIWNASTSQVVYDNRPGEEDTADPGSSIGGGFMFIR